MKNERVVQDIRKSFFRSVNLLGKYRSKFFLSMFLTMLMHGLDLAETLLLAKIAYAMFEIKDQAFYFCVIVVVIIGAISLAVSLAVGKMNFDIQIRAAANLKERLMTILYGRTDFIKGLSEGEQYSILDEDADMLCGFVFQVMSYFFNILTVLVIGVILCIISIKWTFLCAGILLLVTIVQKKGAIKVKDKSRATLASHNEFQRCLNEEIRELHAIRFENLVKKTVRYALGKISDYNNSMIDQNNYVLNLNFICQSILFLGKMGLFLGLGIEVLAGKNSVEEFILFFFYMVTFSDNFMSVIGMISSLQPSLVNVHRLFMVLDKGESKKVQADIKDERLEIALNEIELIDASKQFGENLLFDHVNLKLDLRHTFAFIGDNGSGKSTMMKIFLGEEDISNGKVLLDGKEIESYGMNGLTDICYFSAVPYVATGLSIKDNILLGSNRTKCDSKELLELCKDFLFYKDICEMRDGLDSIVGEELELSSGQKKKIQLMRATLSNAKLILLDEPFANLDENFKESFLNIFERYFSFRKVIVLEHDERRVSYVKKIYCMNNL